jgi:hypothetical protein
MNTSHLDLSKHYVQQWMLCNVVPTIRTNGCSIFVNRIPRPFGYIFGHIHLGLVIHGMMEVCSRFEIWKLISQLLWMLGVTQHWRGCSPHHKIKLPTFCPNLVFWLNSIPRVMKHVKRFECCYLLIFNDPLCCLWVGENLNPFQLKHRNRFSFH